MAPGMKRRIRGGRRMQRAIIIIALVDGGIRENAIYFLWRIFIGGFCEKSAVIV